MLMLKDCGELRRGKWEDDEGLDGIKSNSIDDDDVVVSYDENSRQKRKAPKMTGVLNIRWRRGQITL